MMNVQKKFLLIFIFSLFLIVLMPSTFAAFTCDSGTLSTTCVVNTFHGVTSNEIISGTGNMIITSTGKIFNDSVTQSSSFTINMDGFITIESGGVLSTNQPTEIQKVTNSGSITVIANVLNNNGTIDTRSGDIILTNTIIAPCGDSGLVNITANTFNLQSNGQISTTGCKTDAGNAGLAGDLIITSADVNTELGSNIITQGGTSNSNTCGGFEGSGGNGGDITIIGSNSVVMKSIVNAQRGNGICDDGLNGTINIVHGISLDVEDASYIPPANFACIGFSAANFICTDRTTTCDINGRSNVCVNIIDTNNCGFPFNGTFDSNACLPLENTTNIAAMAALVFLIIGFFISMIKKGKK